MPLVVSPFHFAQSHCVRAPTQALLTVHAQLTMSRSVLQRVIVCLDIHLCGGALHNAWRQECPDTCGVERYRHSDCQKQSCRVACPQGLWATGRLYACYCETRVARLSWLFSNHVLYTCWEHSMACTHQKGATVFEYALHFLCHRRSKINGKFQSSYNCAGLLRVQHPRKSSDFHRSSGVGFRPGKDS